MQFIQFPDRCVTYSVFMEDLAKRVAIAVKEMEGEPRFMSQRQAFAAFGRANVERWRRQGKVEPCVRPGKVEYRTADLRRLQLTKQDYLIR